MAKTETKYDFMPYWKNEQKCFEDAKVEGKDTRTGKKASGFWPRDTPSTITISRMAQEGHGPRYRRVLQTT